jgi:sulfur carrier protein ThiS
MRSIILALAVILGLTTPSLAAMSPKTAAYLKQLGINPNSRAVVTVENDVVPNKEYGNLTLDSLAAANDRHGIVAFIHTRNYLRAFRVNVNANEPSDYNIMYLTPAEKKYIANKLIELYDKVFNR